MMTSVMNSPDIMEVYNDAENPFIKYTFWISLSCEDKEYVFGEVFEWCDKIIDEIVIDKKYDTIISYDMTIRSLIPQIMSIFDLELKFQLPIASIWFIAATLIIILNNLYDDYNIDCRYMYSYSKHVLSIEHLKRTQKAILELVLTDRIHIVNHFNYANRYSNGI